MLLSEVRKKLKKIYTYGEIKRPFHAYEIINFSSIKSTVEPNIVIVREETENVIIISFLLCQNDYVIGYVSAEYFRKFVNQYCWWMGTVKIREDLRKQGLGTKLMKKFQEYFKGQIIYTNVGDENLFGWYKRLGWRIIGQNRNDVGSPVIDEQGRKSWRIVYGDNGDNKATTEK